MGPHYHLTTGETSEFTTQHPSHPPLSNGEISNHNPKKENGYSCSASYWQNEGGALG